MPDQPRFYLDEMVDPAVAGGLRRRGIDVLTTGEAGRISATDIDQLEFARLQGRILFTQDEDFLAMAAGDREHAGIAYLHQQQFTVGRAVRGLLSLYEKLSPAEARSERGAMTLSSRWELGWGPEMGASLRCATARVFEILDAARRQL
ncbi:MAG: DUF5615 family PIN-like protein [Vulcanimicrobiota bacterium]